MSDIVIIKGGGELGTGVALTLFRNGYDVIITELEKPMVVVRTVSFSSAIYEDEFTVEGVNSKKVENIKQALTVIEQGKIPVIVDPKAKIVRTLKPHIIVDAIMAKKNTGTTIEEAKKVIGIGPGFNAGKDVHLVIETHGKNLGRVISKGKAEKDTGIPIEIEGITTNRVLKAPVDGIFCSNKKIGDSIKKGEAVGWIDGHTLVAQIDGVLRGLLHNNVKIKKGTKVGEIDPRGIKEYCFIVSEKAREIGDGVLNAINQF